AVLAAGAARAEPYLMVREGAKCSACHTNQTGGGKRTAFAHIHAHDIEHDLDLLPVPPGVKPFNGELNSYASIGGDLRVQNDKAFIRAHTNYTFQTPDEGGEIGIQPGPFFLASSITNGTPGDKDVAATVNGYTMLEDVPVVRHLLAGASFARQSNKRYVG